MQVTVRYGATASITRDFPHGTTYAEVVQQCASALGYDPTNVNVLSQGEIVANQGAYAVPQDGETIRIEKRAAQKA